MKNKTQSYTLRNNEIFTKYNSGESSVDLANQYGISRQRICDILKQMGVILRNHEDRKKIKFSSKSMSLEEIHSKQIEELNKQNVKIYNELRKSEQIRFTMKLYYNKRIKELKDKLKCKNMK